tara:strand:- start:1928 stop:2518 length:591 start_codon:yes stop_codon:yes gene_type:complete
MSGIGSMIGGGASALLGLGTAIGGAVKSKRAKKEMENLERPTYEIPTEYLANLNQAERMALQGLPEEQKRAYVQQQERNQANQLRAVSQGGNASRSISSIQQGNQDSMMQLMGADSAARMNNMQSLMNQRTTLAQEKEKQWNINEYQPYVQEYNQLASDITGAQSLNQHGLNTMMQGVGSMGVGYDAYKNPNPNKL